MNKESKDFLQSLLIESSPSGFEEGVQNIWRTRTEKYADRVIRDVLGNTTAILNSSADFKVMLAGHCDEIGFIITHISDDGFLYFEEIGGIDRAVLSGSQVIISNSKNVKGIIGKKAIHLEDSDDRGKVPKIKDLFIDIGANNKKDVEKLVAVGDPVSFLSNYLPLQNDNFSSKGCDDKVGAFVVSEVIKILSKHKAKLQALQVGVYATATVQEEVGLRGAIVSAYNINPDIGFAVDVCFSSDTPTCEKKELGNVELGKGGVVHPGPVTNRILLELIKKVSKRKNIPHQIQACGCPDSTDTGMIQLSRTGTATALISIPNRYMHTMVETCSFKDLESTAKLIAETILAINPKMDFIPK